MLEQTAGRSHPWTVEARTKLAALDSLIRF
jgi:hypothetical protein